MSIEIDEARLLQTFCELVRIASPSRHEAAVAAYCRKALEDAGWQVSEDDSAKVTGSDTGNLTATLTGEAPGRIFFSAHMDTVEPSSGIEPVVSDGVIRPAGETILGGDDKVGIAALLELARVVGGCTRPLPTISIVLSVEEEIGLLGAKAYDASAMAGWPCFVLDAAGQPGTAVVGAPYQHSFTARFIGKAAHAGLAPEEGISAIEAAAAAIAGMRLGRIDEQTTANIGIVQGGKANNIVAEECMVTGEFRSHDLKRLMAVREELEASLEAGAAAFGAAVETAWEENYQGFYMADDDPLLAFFLNTARKLGLKAGSEVTGGGADVNIFAQAKAKAMSIGTGMSNIHSTAEYLRVRDLEDLARLVIALATDWQACP